MLLASKEEKKEKIKKYFFTNMISTEIMAKVGLTYNEYNTLLKDVKKDLNLPDCYRRNPRKYGKYHKGCYMVLDTENNLVDYFPTEEIAIRNKDDGSLVLKADDEELLNLLENDFDKNISFEELMVKYKLPYHKALDLIKKMKNRKGISTNQNRVTNKYHHIYKYPPNNRLVIKKYIDGKMMNFGYYDDYDDALKMRDYLEEINWNHNIWLANRNNVLR